jgi:ribosome-binding ATPase YchF (GTP1/OBG family)
VVAFEDFKAHNNNQPSMAGAKAAGKYRIEGKGYEVKDGDIVSSFPCLCLCVRVWVNVPVVW